MGDMQIVTDNGDEHILRTGETLSLEKASAASSRKFHADSPGSRPQSAFYK
jgi:hypothetical protein